MSALEDIIRKLEAARDDVRAQAVTTAEFALALQTDSICERLRSALDAAAVLRWFDVPLLGRLLELGEAEGHPDRTDQEGKKDQVIDVENPACPAQRENLVVLFCGTELLGEKMMLGRRPPVWRSSDLGALA